jgi:hypothetical protein
MLDWMGNRLSTRKKRLFAVACCRIIWQRLSDGRSRQAVDVAERYADGKASAYELQAAREAADSADKSVADRTAAWVAFSATDPSAFDAARYVANVSPSPDSGNLIRDLIGNPFLPATVDPSWLTSTVVALAQSVYDERAFDRLPILADALEDAGCSDAAILNHCREPGEHVRGCWVVDLLLGKS